MGLAAIRPGHLAEPGIAEVRAADIAASEPIVVGIEQLATALDLIERERGDRLSSLVAVQKTGQLLGLLGISFFHQLIPQAGKLVT